MKKRVLAALLAATMAIGMLAGCSTPKTNKQEDSSSESGEKVFRYSSRTEPTTLDPSKTNCIPDCEIQHAITEGLVRNTGGEVTPGVASDWTVSDDGLVYTFNLNPDAKWSD